MVDTADFKTSVIRKLELEHLLDHSVGDLSGGELQRAAIAACLASDADIYLFDEPSAFLDIEQRLASSGAIRRMVQGRQKTAFIVEHSILMADYLSDSMVVFGGTPGKEGRASSVTTLPPVTYETKFTVNWSGSDARSGLRWYHIQVRDTSRSDSQWEDWLVNTPKTTEMFQAQPGHTYAFRVRAMDNVGNWEDWPAADEGDTKTLVDPSSAPTTAWWEAAYAHKRNLIILNQDTDTMPVMQRELATILLPQASQRTEAYSGRHSLCTT